MTGTYLTVREVAEYLRVGPMTIYRLIKRGEMPATLAGKKFIIDAAKLEEFIERNRTVPTAERA